MVEPRSRPELRCLLGADPLALGIRLTKRSSGAPSLMETVGDERSEEGGKHGERSHIANRGAVLAGNAGHGVTGGGADVHDQDEEGAASGQDRPEPSPRPALP